MADRIEKIACLRLRGPIRRDFPIVSSCTIGRQEDADIRIHEDAGVSRCHARIEYRHEGWVIIDLGSRTGTFVNLFKLSPERALNHGDLIFIGSHSFQFILGSVCGDDADHIGGRVFEVPKIK